ncbi:hypothetical protein PVAP13_3NG140704 [Panicum virgatum]|uniref:Uncharacterized protein n=1 Tax=Panicum virgatum TaxID=38727 RepID=A0A8T0U2Y8_PANVG|nr:hypothetical protein PVAP13_3NG140704 [Panicum virgatum]
MNGVLLLFVVCLACPFVMDAYRDKKTNNTRSKSSDQPQTNGMCWIPALDSKDRFVDK